MRTPQNNGEPNAKSPTAREA